MHWLKAENYLTPLRRLRSGTDFVHLARLRFGREVITAYVKICRPHTPGGAAAEAVGYLLARHLPRARRACLITLRGHQIAGSQPPRWVQDLDDPLVAFCSEAVPADTLLTLADGADDEDQLWRDVLGSEEGPHIAGLDHWCANDDRHGGNLLRMSSRHWCVIDHGRVFGHAEWTTKGPLHQARTQLLIQAEKRLKGRALSGFHANVILASQAHAARLLNSQAAIASCITRLHGATVSTAALRFLHARARHDWMSDQLGQIG